MPSALKHKNDPLLERPRQILRAATECFARNGFHQTTMQDISTKAGISVGLIYRYFANKEMVISAMAAEHKRDIQIALERARLAPGLLEALEVLFTCTCEDSDHAHAAFVVDLFAEAGRNREVAKIVRGVMETMTRGVMELVEADAATKSHLLGPSELTQLIFALNHGLMMRSVLDSRTHETVRRKGRLALVRSFWKILLEHEKANGAGHVSRPTRRSRLVKR